MHLGITWAAPDATVLDVVAALGPLAVLISLALTVGQKWHADRRSEFWRRATWAMDHAMSGDEEKSATGWAMLEKLTQERLWRKEAIGVFDAFSGARLDQVEADGETEGVEFEVDEREEER